MSLLLLFAGADGAGTPPPPPEPTPTVWSAFMDRRGNRYEVRRVNWADYESEE